MRQRLQLREHPNPNPNLNPNPLTRTRTLTRCANVFNCESALNTLNLIATMNGLGKGALPGLWGTLNISEVLKGHRTQVLTLGCTSRSPNP